MEISDWDGLLRACPAVELEGRRAGANSWTALGFAVDETGWVVVKDLPEETIKEIGDQQPVTDWKPLPSSDLITDRVAALGSSLVVEGVDIATSGGGDGSKAFLRLTKRYLLGGFSDGLSILGWEASKPTYGPLRGESLCFRWPLDDIAEIQVTRRRKYMKLWDAEFSISGRANSAIFRAEDLVDLGKSVPGSGSILVRFGHLLASAVEGTGRPSANGWIVSRDDGDEVHTISFE